MRKVAILFGTMTGTAELVAAEVQTALEGAGVEATVEMMDGLNASALGDDAVYLICTSTYGNGDVPDNGQSFFAGLETNRPDLSRVAFGSPRSAIARTICAEHRVARRFTNVRQGLPGAVQVSALDFIEELPKSATGKIQRHVLRNREAELRVAGA